MSESGRIDGSARTGQNERGERSAVEVNSKGCLRDCFISLPLMRLNQLCLPFRGVRCEGH